MRRNGSVILAIALAGLPLDVEAQRPQVIERVTVIDVQSGQRLANRFVVVDRGHITAVDSGRSPVLSRATRIDGRGRFLIPGLWDMHVHTAFDPLTKHGPLATMDTGGARYHLPLFVANGVTGIRDMGGDLRITRSLQGRVRTGEIPGPRALLTGEKLGFRPVVPGAPFPVRSDEDVRRSVELLRASGANFVKVDGIPRERYPALMAAARKAGLPVDGHVPVVITLDEASAFGQRTVEHLNGALLAASSKGDAVRKALLADDDHSFIARVERKLGWLERPRNRQPDLVATYDSSRARRVFSALARAHTWQVPTLRVIAVLTRRDALVPPVDSDLVIEPLRLRALDAAESAFQSKLWEAHARIVRDMHAVGVPLLAGTDTPILNAVPGSSLHDELALFVAAGLTPLEALRTATLNVGRLLETDSVGVVRSGGVADLVLLDADPLADIGAVRRIHGVMAAGRWYPRASLERLVDSARATVRASRAP